MLAGNIREKSIAEPKLPLAEVLVLCGFFMVYVVEELAHTFAIWAHGRFRENKGGEGSSAEIAAASHGGGDSGHKDIVIEPSATRRRSRSRISSGGAEPGTRPEGPRASRYSVFLARRPSSMPRPQQPARNR